MIAEVLFVNYMRWRLPGVIICGIIGVILIGSFVDTIFSKSDSGASVSELIEYLKRDITRT